MEPRITQAEFDSAVKEFISELTKECEPIGGIQKALVEGWKPAMDMVVDYCLVAVVNAEKMGLAHKSISDLLGFEVTVNELVIAEEK